MALVLFEIVNTDDFRKPPRNEGVFTVYQWQTSDLYLILQVAVV